MSASDCNGYWDPSDQTCMPYTTTSSTSSGRAACLAAGGKITKEKVGADSELALYRGKRGRVWEYAKPGTEVSICVFPDGSACREDMFESGQCLSDEMENHLEKSGPQTPPPGPSGHALPDGAFCPPMLEFDGEHCVGMSDGTTGVLLQQDPSCTSGVWDASEHACVPEQKSGSMLKTIGLVALGAAAVLGIGYVVFSSGSSSEPRRATNPRKAKR